MDLKYSNLLFLDFVEGIMEEFVQLMVMDSLNLVGIWR